MTQTADIPYPIVSINGLPSHVLVPIADWNTLSTKSVADGHTFVPLDVGEAVLDGDSPLKAWRNHKRLTQEGMAERMGVTRSSYAQMEKSGRPQQKTLERAAVIFGTTVSALAELYDE